MNPRALTWAAVGLLAVGCFGCRKPSASGGASTTEEPITGKPSDPAVVMQAAWNPGHRYVFRLDLTSSSPMPRRNSTQPTAQDTTIGEDFSLTVTNVAENGTRRMQCEILTVQMESSVGDKINLSYDSESRIGNMEENATIERLKKLKGVSFAFRVSAQNKITGSDGLRNLNDRMAGGNGRGGGRDIGGGGMGRLMDPKIFRELIEMSALPSQPVHIGDTWTVKQEVSSGTGVNLPVDVIYTFKGWQKRDERSCARLEFSGVINPAAPERNNRRGGGGNGGGMSVEGGTLSGTTWFDPKDSLPIETVVVQSINVKGASGARGPRRQGGTNAPSATNVPQAWTGIVRQQSVLKLLEAKGD